MIISVRPGLQRFKPLDPNASVPGRIISDNTSLSSLSVGGVPRQKFLLVTMLDKDVSLTKLCFTWFTFMSWTGSVSPNLGTSVKLTGQWKCHFSVRGAHDDLSWFRD